MHAVFGFDGRQTRLCQLYEKSPCRGLLPAVEPGEPPQLVLVNTGGGVVGGDHLRINIGLEAGAAATLTTVAAEKAYRAVAEPARIDATLSLGDRAYVEWLPQEMILFDGARLERRLTIDLSDDATLLAVEMVILGRLARGENFTQGWLRDAWCVRRHGKPAWIDALGLDGTQRGNPFGFGFNVAYATIVIASPTAPALLDDIRHLLDEYASEGAATLVNGLIIIRFLAEDAHRLRLSIGTLLAELRHRLHALPRLLPRLWLT